MARRSSPVDDARTGDQYPLGVPAHGNDGIHFDPDTAGSQFDLFFCTYVDSSIPEPTTTASLVLAILGTAARCRRK
jgi:PEP-CTERM motif